MQGVHAISCIYMLIDRNYIASKLVLGNKYSTNLIFFCIIDNYIEYYNIVIF